MGTLLVRGLVGAGPAGAEPVWQDGGSSDVGPGPGSRLEDGWGRLPQSGYYLQWRKAKPSILLSWARPDMSNTRVTLLDTAPIPNSGGELGLYRHGEDFVIKVVGGQDLMSTRTHGSADALAEIACTEITRRERPRVLIGGLGMGFTLASALRHLGHDAEVVVAELVPGVVEWNRGPLGEHAGDPLRDERVTVQEVDVSLVLRAGGPSFDAILLDVDNGPEGLTQRSNDWLYSKAGLNVSYRALRPKGVLALWSAGPDRAFTKRLVRAGFEVDEVPVRAHRGKGARHLIWVARKPGR